MTLYLKYRPQDFSSLVGQEFIKETLKKAVAEDKTVGAYVFTGPRGTGKTSTARIFAKAINCQKKKYGDPCLECDICQAFRDSSLIDIIEIDAASHTGVDNIREIIEKAQFRPTKTQYKIYIIDEVHMLSKGAFNALLKILEEPPEHVKFILATTEIHKVPDTILSRCQRYDFRSITQSDIRSRLKYIAKHEKVEVDDDSYYYIVRNAEGGLRNAISLFEQLIVDSRIHFSHISKTLGVSSEQEIEMFLEKLLKKDSSIMSDFLELSHSGKNLKHFFKALMNILKEKAILEIGKGNNIRNKLELLELLQDMLMKLKNSFDEQLTIQIGLLKILSSGQSIPALAPVKREKLVEKVKEKSEEPAPVGETEKLVEVEAQDSLLEQTQDIFGSEKPFEELGGQKGVEEDFNAEALITESKAQGAKAALTMSMRGSNMILENGILRIQTKTKISLSTIQKPESREYIQRAGEALELNITTIEVV